MEKKITITSGLEFKIDYGNMDNVEILSTLNSIKRDIEKEERRIELKDFLIQSEKDFGEKDELYTNILKIIEKK